MDPKEVAEQRLEKALVAQMPVIRKNVERLRRHPRDNPKQMIRRLDACPALKTRRVQLP